MIWRVETYVQIRKFLDPRIGNLVSFFVFICIESQDTLLDEMIEVDENVAVVQPERHGDGDGDGTGLVVCSSLQCCC